MRPIQPLSIFQTQNPSDILHVQLNSSLKGTPSITSTADGTIYSGMVEITPAMAFDWLENRNLKNRRMNPTHRNWLSSQIEQGRWQDTGQSIQFDKNGNLIDGQHRLASCVHTKKSFRSYVTWGLEPETQFVLDRQRPRKAADDLLMAGHNFPRSRVAIVSIAAGLLHNKPYAPIKTVSSYQDYLPLFEEGLEAIFKKNMMSFKFVRRAPVSGAIVFAYRQNPTKVNEFMDDLRNGANLPDKHPVLLLRDWLLGEQHMRLPNQGTVRQEMAYRTLYAIRNSIDGKSISRFRRDWKPEPTVSFFRTAYNGMAFPQLIEKKDER